MRYLIFSDRVFQMLCLYLNERYATVGEKTYPHCGSFFFFLGFFGLIKNNSYPLCDTSIQFSHSALPLMRVEPSNYVEALIHFDDTGRQ